MLVAVTLNWKEGIMSHRARENAKKRAKVKRKSINITIILILLKDCSAPGNI